MAAVVPGSAGPVHRHLPNIHHTHRYDLIHVALQAKTIESGKTHEFTCTLSTDSCSKMHMLGRLHGLASEVSPV